MAMSNNDFLGSFAQENVIFNTQIIRSVAVGDNFWKFMIFVENDRFVTINTDWVDAPGLTGIKCLTVTVDDFATQTRDQLKNWLTDLFATGFSGDCILVACAAKIADDNGAAFITKMTEAYNALKAYAYHKTVCACKGADNNNTFCTEAAVELAKLCAPDTKLYSSVPYFPYSNAANVSDPPKDALYKALADDTLADAFMAHAADTSRNAAMYLIGQAMSELNGSGTCVGNSLDMVASNMIASSGLDKTVRSKLNGLGIATFKPVGDNTGNVAAEGATSLKGKVIAADWLIAYVTYMAKVRIAQMMTRRGFFKSEFNYGSMLVVLSSILNKFGPSGSGRLENVLITAPAYGSLPAANSDEIIIPNAWAATFVDVLRRVQITGTLYIGG